MTYRDYGKDYQTSLPSKMSLLGLTQKGTMSYIFEQLRGSWEAGNPQTYSGLSKGKMERKVVKKSSLMRY